MLFRKKNVGAFFVVGFQMGKMTACGALRKNRRKSAESPPPVSESQISP